MRLQEAQQQESQDCAVGESHRAGSVQLRGISAKAHRHDSQGPPDMLFSIVRRYVMKNPGIALLAGMALLVLVNVRTSFAEPPSTPAAKIARGKYLVEGVAHCGDCHSP